MHTLHLLSGKAMQTTSPLSQLSPSREQPATTAACCAKPDNQPANGPPIDIGDAVTGISGFLAILAAIWVGIRQIKIASRQADISAEQANIAIEQNKISERQTSIMESQANLEHFHAMRDDLTNLIEIEDFLIGLKMDLIKKNWKSVGQKIKLFQKFELQSSRIGSSDWLNVISLIFDTTEFIFDTRFKTSWQIDMIIFEKTYKHQMLLPRNFYHRDSGISYMVSVTKEIENLLNEISNRRKAIYDTIQGDRRPY